MNSVLGSETVQFPEMLRLGNNTKKFIECSRSLGLCTVQWTRLVIAKSLLGRVCTKCRVSEEGRTTGYRSATQIVRAARQFFLVWE